MADAVLWNILEEVQRALKNDLTFSAQDSDPNGGLPSANMVLRKLKAPRPGQRVNTDELTPGWLICPGESYAAPAEAGPNDRDDVYYKILLQLIDRDNYQKRDVNLHSYLKWLEQARKYFHQSDLNQAIFTTAGYVNRCNAETMMVIDERRWAAHEWYQGAVELTVISREERGVTS